MRITFDADTLDKLLKPELFSKDPFQPEYEKAQSALVTKRILAPTVKQHLACIRMLFDWLVTGQIVPANPAHAGTWLRRSMPALMGLPPFKAMSFSFRTLEPSNHQHRT